MFFCLLFFFKPKGISFPAFVIFLFRGSTILLISAPQTLFSPSPPNHARGFLLPYFFPLAPRLFPSIHG
jgi:hypothetical protein